VSLPLQYVMYGARVMPAAGPSGEAAS
jgi:hypothetical protein